MPEHSEVYEDCTITITDSGELQINDKPIECIFDNEDQAWYSRYLPYARYATQLELARAIIANTEEF